MQMSQDLIDFLNTAFAAPGWNVVSVNEAEQTRLTTDGGDPLVLSEVTERHVTMTVVNEDEDKVLIFMLEGPVSGPLAKINMLHGGSSFETTDATLLERLEGAIALARPILDAAALSALTAEPESE